MLQQSAPVEVVDEIDALDAGLDGLLDADLDRLDRDGLLEAARRFEALKRRLPVFEHRLIAQLEQRGVARELGATSSRALLRGLLRISPGEAKRRLVAALDLGPRRGLTGEVLPPLFPTVAAAQAGGVISAEHAAVITKVVDRIPGALAASHEAQVEAEMVAHAGVFDPDQLAQIGRRLLDVLDPDGTLADDADQQRHRDLTLNRNRDGSFTLTGHLTPECGAVWEPVLDSLARPRPAADGVPDPRRPGQRRHDAFARIPHLIDPRKLPHTGGLPVTLILTATLDDAVAGTGHATTGHGGLIPIPRAIELTASNGTVVSVLFNPHGGIHDYGRTERIVPPAMRLALIARDKGCCFPGCDRPASWAEAHHVQAWADGGDTSLENCVLLCGWHHRQFERTGWHCHMINGAPHWTPPAWADSTQTPIRNTTHDPPL